MKLIFDSEKCTGCSACEMACMDQNDVQGLRQTHLCRIEIKAGIPQFRNCIQCGACVKVCPSGCLSRSEDGVITSASQKCIGCKACADACPVGVISHSPVFGTVQKCDLCVGRVKAGLLPACVYTCPTGALTLAK